MKKIISVFAIFLSCAVIACGFCFIGCSNVTDNTKLYILNLEETEIGASIPVSPSTEFYYTTSSGYTVYVDEFNATLVSKTLGTEDDPFSGTSYRPYVIETSVHGFADPSLEGEKISVKVNLYPMMDTASKSTTIGTLGEFEVKISYKCIDVVGIYLESITI